MDNIKIQKVEVYSTQEWTTDPDMVELTVPASFIPYAEACLDFMSKVKNADEIKNWDGFDYELYQDAENADDTDDADPVVVDGNEYLPFEPEYSLAGCDVRIDRYGDIKVEMPFKHTAEKIWFSLGKLDELKARFEQAQQEEHAAKPKMGM
jgi:hypothetical protein